MGFITNEQTVFGNKRVVFGTASGELAGFVNHTPLSSISHINLTTLTPSGTYSMTVSASGSFTVTSNAASSYKAMIIGI